MATARKTAVQADQTPQDADQAPAASLELAEVPSAAQAETQRHEERKAIGVDLQKIALRLNELGCMQSSAFVLKAAFKLSMLRPGRVA